MVGFGEGDYVVVHGIVDLLWQAVMVDVVV